MNLADITPVILTYNEEANIGRCLAGLAFARDIVVVDSGSDDRTQALCRADPRVRLFTRPFDSHARQWQYAIADTAIATPWILALDADYMLNAKALAEIEALSPHPEIGGYSVPFRYAIEGRVLRSGVYPPVVALFRAGRARYVQDGHTQRVMIDGRVERLARPFIHDDRKPLERWVRSQARYARLEAEKLAAAEGGLKGFLRARTPLSPLAIALYCLVARGALFEGRAGWLYAMQRLAAESLICAAYQDLKLRQ